MKNTHTYNAMARFEVLNWRVYEELSQKNVDYAWKLANQWTEEHEGWRCEILTEWSERFNMLRFYSKTFEDW